MSCLPFWANSGQYLATGANASIWPRSIAINAASAVSVFVQEKKLTMVSSAPWHRLGAVRVAAPDVDDELAVDVDGYRGAELLTVGDLVGERIGDLVEAGIPVAVHDVAHRTIMRYRARSPGPND